MSLGRMTMAKSGEHGGARDEGMDGMTGMTRGGVEGKTTTITTENKMSAQDGKKVGFLTLEDGGRASDRRTHAERNVERAVREIFYAMEGKSKGMKNVAGGVTHPVRMLVRRFREAKRARRDAINYPLAKQAVRALDTYLDELFLARHAGVVDQLRDVEQLLAAKRLPATVITTGDHPRAA